MIPQESSPPRACSTSQVCWSTVSLTRTGGLPTSPAGAASHSTPLSTNALSTRNTAIARVSLAQVGAPSGVLAVMLLFRWRPIGVDRLDPLDDILGRRVDTRQDLLHARSVDGIDVDRHPRRVGEKIPVLHGGVERLPQRR